MKIEDRGECNCVQNAAGTPEDRRHQSTTGSWLLSWLPWVISNILQRKQSGLISPRQHVGLVRCDTPVELLVSPVALEPTHSDTLRLQEGQGHMDYLKRQIKSIPEAHSPPTHHF